MPFDRDAPATRPDPAELAARARPLREAAERLRRLSDEVEVVATDLLAYDRPDVWQGARATAFHDDLRERVRYLTAPHEGVADRLRQTATRAEMRAQVIQSGLPELTPWEFFHPMERLLRR